MKLLSVPIESMTRNEVLDRVRSFLTESKFHRIATVNPEFLVLADKNPQFRRALQTAELRVVDGVGIVLVAFLIGQKLKRFPGADLLSHILRFAEENGHAVYFAVRKDGLSSYKEIRQALLEKFPQLLLVTTPSQAVVVLCSFGAPEQEVYLESLRLPYPNIRLAIGVGGSLDYFTGKQKRAPLLWRTLGLEWLWRLLHQPKRFRRIFIAITIFPYRFLAEMVKNAIIKPHF